MKTTCQAQDEIHSNHNTVRCARHVENSLRCFRSGPVCLPDSTRDKTSLSGDTEQKKSLHKSLAQCICTHCSTDMHQGCPVGGAFQHATQLTHTQGRPAGRRRSAYYPLHTIRWLRRLEEVPEQTSGVQWAPCSSMHASQAYT
jgi:hypothetical protein